MEIQPDVKTTRTKNPIKSIICLLKFFNLKTSSKLHSFILKSVYYNCVN